MIIVGGRNVFPEDIEQRRRRASTACAPATSSRSGSPDGKGREAIVVVAETKADETGAVSDAVSRSVRPGR